MQSGVIDMRFDLSQYYSLLEAFDQTGRRMYGDAWAGLEPFATSTENPEPIKEQRRSIFNEISDLESQKVRHQSMMRADVDSDLLQVASDKLAAIEEQMRPLRERLVLLPIMEDGAFEDFASYERQKSVKEELVDAFKRKELFLQIGPNQVVDWTAWSRYESFRIYFNLSIVRVPDSYLGRSRRLPAFVERTVLEKWLMRFGKPNAVEKVLTLSAQAEILLRQIVERDVTKRKPKPEYQIEIQSELPGLSKRDFDHVWKAVAPNSWRDGGRPKLKQ